MSSTEQSTNLLAAPPGLQTTTASNNSRADSTDVRASDTHIDNDDAGASPSADHTTTAASSSTGLPTTLSTNSSTALQESNTAQVGSSEGSRKRSKAPTDTPRKRLHSSDEVSQEHSEDAEAASDNEVDTAMGDEAGAEMHANTKEAEVAAAKLPYRSVVCINIPPRSNAQNPVPRNAPVPNDPKSWYGAAACNYENSMIIYWVDELKLSYTQGKNRYKQLFNRNLSDEMVRRRHLCTLGALSLKYGLKNPADIPNPDRQTARRGKARPHRSNDANQNKSASNFTIIRPKQPGSTSAVANNAQPVNGNDASQKVNGSAKPTSTEEPVPEYVTKAPFKHLEKLAIVVYKDLEKLSFKEIRQRMEDKYNWSLGLPTISKYYHTTREAAYTYRGVDTSQNVATDGDETLVDDGTEGDETLVDDGTETKQMQHEGAQVQAGDDTEANNAPQIKGDDGGDAMVLDTVLVDNAKIAKMKVEGVEHKHSDADLEGARTLAELNLHGRGRKPVDEHFDVGLEDPSL